MYEIYLQSFVLYFVVIDPFGTTPIFMSLTKNLNAKEKIKSALEKSCLSCVNIGGRMRKMFVLPMVALISFTLDMLNIWPKQNQKRMFWS